MVHNVRYGRYNTVCAENYESLERSEINPALIKLDWSSIVYNAISSFTPLIFKDIVKERSGL